jgi:hypothetical protein
MIVLVIAAGRGSADGIRPTTTQTETSGSRVEGTV